MNIDALKKQLTIDEGRINFVYSDLDGKPTWPNRDKGNPTFGIGHLLTKHDIEFFTFNRLAKGGKLSISDERIDQVFEKDVNLCIKDCHQLFEKFEQLPEDVQQILANMMFNLGLSKLTKFKHLICSINEKNYKIAAKEMKDSDWFEQTKNRAKRLVARMSKVANDSLCRC